MTGLFLKPSMMTAALAALALTPVAAKAPPPMLTKALADTSRPQADRDRDAARHPAELLALLDLKPGAEVADFIMGGGYWTRILSNAVGSRGKVYAYQPAEFIQYRAAYGTEQDAAVAGRANVTAQRDSLASFGWPEPLDAIVTVQNWHDLHLKVSPPGFGAMVAKKLYAALKPGGVLLVVDHVGANTAGPFGDSDSLHRGDPAGTKAEVESAGFKLAATSPLYANPADPHTALVFDQSIRSKTDQFVYKFVKPKS